MNTGEEEKLFEVNYITMQAKSVATNNYLQQDKKTLRSSLALEHTELKQRSARGEALLP